MHGIERDNARQWHWLVRFRRRSVVVSKAKRKVDVNMSCSLALLATTGSAISGLCSPKTLSY